MRIITPHLRVLTVALAAMSLCVLLAACNDYATQTYKTLAAMGQTYDAIMSFAGDAYKRGLIGDEEREKIETAGNVFYGSWHTAHTALEAYVAAQDTPGETPELKRLLTEALTTAATDFADLESYYERICAGVSGAREED